MVWQGLASVNLRLGSGTEAAVGPEGRKVGGLVKEPEPFPVITGKPEVFGVDEQFLDSLGSIARIVGQRNRAHPSPMASDATTRARAARDFLMTGLLPFNGYRPNRVRVAPIARR